MIAFKLEQAENHAIMARLHYSELLGCPRVSRMKFSFCRRSQLNSREGIGHRPYHVLIVFSVCRHGEPCIYQRRIDQLIGTREIGVSDNIKRMMRVSLLSVLSMSIFVKLFPQGLRAHAEVSISAARYILS